MQSKRGIRRALEYAGWEVRWSAPTGDDGETIVGGYGPYRLVVCFDADRGESTSVLTHRAHSQGVFTERWRGVELLPTPEEAVRRLSRRDTEGVLPTTAPDAAPPAPENPFRETGRPKLKLRKRPRARRSGLR